ncbi:unnamed protein product [Brachionus calyciflorus]|uniref:Uncharacterized protein n=1 Tax=Brachionus calyciflorus TaxID=104777 RepID=A0A814EI41_9BILA|nr:unnamed protein product [Brachionus calyciflorus]
MSDEKLRDQIGELQASLINKEEQITLLNSEKKTIEDREKLATGERLWLENQICLLEKDNQDILNQKTAEFNYHL